MLDKSICIDKLLEGIFGCEVVFTAIFLARAWIAGCVFFCKYVSRDRGYPAGLHSRETEKPNLSGNSSNRRFKSVDLPVPLGPLMTTGLNWETVNFVLVVILYLNYGINCGLCNGALVVGLLTVSHG